MASRNFVRWCVFVVYLALFFVIPLNLLFEKAGFIVGIVLAGGALLYMGWRATERISRRLGVRELSRAEVPQFYQVLGEYCRRLEIDTPKLGVIESESINFVAFGFSPRTSIIGFTRGALKDLNREEMASMIGRQLIHIKLRDTFTASWLSQFLNLVDRLVVPITPKNLSSVRREYSFQLFFRQIFLYPLTLIPIRVLKSAREPQEMDLLSVRVTKNPVAFSEALRRMHAMSERRPHYCPFSARHLFLLPPGTQDPLARVLFSQPPLTERIEALKQLSQTVTLS